MQRAERVYNPSPRGRLNPPQPYAHDGRRGPLQGPYGFAAVIGPARSVRDVRVRALVWPCDQIVDHVVDVAGRPCRGSPAYGRFLDGRWPRSRPPMSLPMFSSDGAADIKPAAAFPGSCEPRVVRITVESSRRLPADRANSTVASSVPTVTAPPISLNRCSQFARRLSIQQRTRRKRNHTEERRNEDEQRRSI